MIDYVIAVVRTERKISKNFFEDMEGTEGIFEIKVKVGNNILTAAYIILAIAGLTCLLYISLKNLESTN